MNKLPKEIYVEEISAEPIYHIDPESCAVPGKTVTLAVYKFVGTVEVSTQMKQEIVIKKAPKAAKKKTAKSDAPEPDPERNPLLDELKVTGEPYRPTNVSPEMPRTFA